MKIKKKELQNSQELYDYFFSLNNKVPPRHENKHQERQIKIEIYCLEEILVTLAYHNRLQFPITICQTESPDFMIHYPGGIVGLEVTEATHQKYQS